MWRLVWTNLWQRRVRTLLTVAAVALSIALVVSTTTGYRSAETTVREFIDLFLGTSDIRFGSGADAGGMPGSLLDEVRADPQVRSAFGRLELRRPFRDAQGEPIGGQIAVLGVDPLTDGYLHRLPMSYGRRFEHPDAREVLLDEGARRLLGVELGETIQLPGAGGPVDLELVGVVHKPRIMWAFFQTVYAPLHTLQEVTFPDDPRRYTRLEAELHIGVSPEEFAARWQRKLLERGVVWEVGPVRQQREAVDRALGGMELLSLTGGLAALLAATFIVFGTLSMGVSERQRALAMLRAVGMTRRQVGTAVVAEGLVVAALGVGIGVPLGIAFIHGLALWFEEIFTAGVVISGRGVLAAAGGMTLATLAAAALPAWAASRVDPLEAMRPSAAPPRAGPPWPAFVAGLLLICIDPLLTWPTLGASPLPLQLEKDLRFWLHYLLGLPTLMLGFFLLAPMAVWAVDRALAKVAAWALGLEPALLRQQLSGGLWRAAGTAAALMVGLAVLVLMNTQGRSSIEGWQLPERFPDVFFYDYTGIDQRGVEIIAQAPEIRRMPDGSPDISPIGFFNPMLGESVFALAGGAFTPERTMFIAVDPDRIFELIDLEYTAGDRDLAIRMLQRGREATLDDGTTVHGTFERMEEREVFLTLPAGDAPAVAIDPGRVVSHDRGRYLLITQEFRELRGTSVGDPFALRRPGEGVIGRLRGRPIEFTVAGVVRSPGIDVLVSVYDLGRQFQAQSAASVFGTLADAREHFGITQVRLVAANLEPGVDKNKLVERLAEQTGQAGISVSDIRDLKEDIQRGLWQVLALASTVAWSAMAVASLGVVNTIMAGVRSRRYQLGVLRAVGVTRGQVLRLVLAESLLLGIAAAVLGVAAGLAMTLNARAIQAWTIGYVPPLRVAWEVVLIGVAVVLAVSVLAALYPATTTARSGVLRLLQAGRGAA